MKHAFIPQAAANAPKLSATEHCRTKKSEALPPAIQPAAVSEEALPEPVAADAAGNDPGGGRRFRILLHISTVLGLVGASAFLVYGIHTEIFTSETALSMFLERLGLWAPVLFILIQAIQVVVPILPGSIGCLAGVAIFGPGMGFLYNYIGICTGSIAAFGLARCYGRPLVLQMGSRKHLEKYMGWLDTGRAFDRLFAAAIFFPVAPDDFLCYLAGITRMKASTFMLIILLGKPVSIALYSTGLYFAASALLNIFS